MAAPGGSASRRAPWHYPAIAPVHLVFEEEDLEVVALWLAHTGSAMRVALHPAQLQGRANEVVTQDSPGLTGEFGQDWHLLTAGALITMAVPQIVFFSLQRDFVRGLTAGPVEG